MRNDHSHTLSPVHRNPVFDNTRWYGPGFRSPSRKRGVARNLRRNSVRPWRGTVATRSLSGRDGDDGAQISFGDDHRWPGGLRERLLSRFFFFQFFISFAVATGPVGTKTWSGESSSTLIVLQLPRPRECEREKRDERETRGMDEEDRREPFELTNPV